MIVGAGSAHVVKYGMRLTSSLDLNPSGIGPLAKPWIPGCSANSLDFGIGDFSTPRVGRLWTEYRELVCTNWFKYPIKLCHLEVRIENKEEKE